MLIDCKNKKTGQTDIARVYVRDKKPRRYFHDSVFFSDNGHVRMSDLSITVFLSRVYARDVRMSGFVRNVRSGRGRA